MTASKKPFFITTAIAYVNGSPHLGHAYEAILTDVIARFKRLDGFDVMFLTGTDEHGEKVAKTAEKNGMTPLAFADLNAAKFEAMDKLLNISHDDFIRTTQPRHYAACQALWAKLKEKGDIYLGKYEGWYSVREEGYFTEDELTLDPSTGIRYSPNGTEVEWVEESSYFFKLSEYTERLLQYYEAHPEFIEPSSRRNEVISFVKQGLKDLSVSRHKSRLAWGIPVPDDADHVMYVWLDALTNYITALGYPNTINLAYDKYWPAHYHVIGKDITRFHAVYWPAFLMSAELPLPRTIFAHGFINVQGQKMSKSIGNVLSPDTLVETFGLDSLRYLLMREITHGQDGNFSHEHTVQRINADLANSFGNLAQRTLSMIHKNCDEAFPAPGEYTDKDKELLARAYTLITEMREDFEPAQGSGNIAINHGLAKFNAVVDLANVYVDEQAPWTLRKEDPERMKTVLYVLAETIRCLALTIQPVIPGSAARMLDQLKVPEDRRQFVNIRPDYALEPGTPIDKPEGVFPRIALEETAGDQAAG